MVIEVDKGDLVDLPDLVELVADRPERFIVYCDDLSFDEGEPGYFSETITDLGAVGTSRLDSGNPGEGI